MKTLTKEESEDKELVDSLFDFELIFDANVHNANNYTWSISNNGLTCTTAGSSTCNWRCVTSEMALQKNRISYWKCTIHNMNGNNYLMLGLIGTDKPVQHAMSGIPIKIRLLMEQILKTLIRVVFIQTTFVT